MEFENKKHIGIDQSEQISDKYLCKSHIVLGLKKHKDLIIDKIGDRVRKVLILNTGGTISMFPSECGYVTKSNKLLEFMKNNPQLCDLDYTYFQSNNDFLITPESVYQRRIWYKVKELDKLLDSSNMNPQHWFLIARYIEKEYQNFDSFIILHGTDTMAYTASALSFMFENLTKTIVITGSQVPLSQPRNDGFSNLINAMNLAGHFTIPEVLIVFYDKLLRGNRSQKINSSQLDSFDSPKYQPLGVFGIREEIHWELIRSVNKQDENLKVTEHLSSAVRAIKMTPLTGAETFEIVLNEEGIRGLVIETYGAGNMKTESDICEIIKDANNRGVIIVNISQCQKSTVQMLYETGIIYERIGVIQGGDLTLEAAVTKLSYLLGKDLTNAQVKDLIQKDLRGELTPSTIGNKFNLDEEPFLKELSSAISEGKDIEISRDKIMPNILCLMCKQDKKVHIFDFSKININIKALDYDNKSILHVAAKSGAIELLQQLINYNQQTIQEIINVEDRFGHSALFEALLNRQKEIINLLLNKGGKVIVPKNEFTNLLMKVVDSEDMEFLELCYQADIRDFDKYRTIDNRTIGHLAATNNYVAIVQFLRKPGITFDWSIKDRWGRTALDECQSQRKGYLNPFARALQNI